MIEPTKPPKPPATTRNTNTFARFITIVVSIAKESASPNAKVSDGNQQPMTFDWSLSKTAGSRSLHRPVRRLFWR